jgi:hypothetical protein
MLCRTVAKYFGYHFTKHFQGFTEHGFAIENSKISITKPHLLFILNHFP